MSITIRQGSWEDSNSARDNCYLLLLRTKYLKKSTDATYEAMKEYDTGAELLDVQKYLEDRIQALRTRIARDNAALYDLTQGLNHIQEAVIRKICHTAYIHGYDNAVEDSKPIEPKAKTRKGGKKV